MARHLEEQELRDLHEEEAEALHEENPYFRGRPVYSRGPIIVSLLIAYLICFSASVGGLYWQWTDLQKQCDESAVNREAIRDSLKRSFSNLGYIWLEERQEAIKVGPPALDYYREHPHEIGPQVDRLRQELDGFPPIIC